MGKVILSCGHEDKANPYGFEFVYKDTEFDFWSGEVVEVDRVAYLCTRCYLEEKENKDGG